MLKQLAIILSLITFSTSAHAVYENIVVGEKDAPVEVKVYYSLQCPACAYFHTDVAPLIKRDYVKNGKAKIEYAPYPVDFPSLALEGLLACVDGKDNHREVLHNLFNNYDKWSQKENKSQAIKPYFLKFMSEEDFKACSKDKESFKKVARRIQVYRDKKIVRATPTVFVNGSMVDDPISYNSIRNKIKTFDN